MKETDFPHIDMAEITKAMKPKQPITPDQYMWADSQFQILKRYVQSFEQSLDSDHEVGIMMTNFGQNVLMTVTQINYEYPVLMVFHGLVNGREVTLIQHINQLNFMLTTVEKEPDRQKQPIGFVTNQNEEIIKEIWGEEPAE